jgi:hypothetical protein
MSVRTLRPQRMFFLQVFGLHVDMPQLPAQKCRCIPRDFGVVD